MQAAGKRRGAVVLALVVGALAAIVLVRGCPPDEAAPPHLECERGELERYMALFAAHCERGFGGEEVHRVTDAVEALGRDDHVVLPFDGVVFPGRPGGSLNLRLLVLRDGTVKVWIEKVGRGGAAEFARTAMAEAWRAGRSE